MTKASEAGASPAAPSEDRAIEQKVVQFAEQLGYVVGTIQARAEGWLDRDTLKGQITSVRKAAADLLAQVTPPVRPRRKVKPAAAARKQAAKPAPKGRGPVDAPGKRHRKPAAESPSVKHSDERIAKLRTAEANRQRRKY